MTGEKDRYRTQEKLWKIDDEQLTTPKHDEMVIQLLNKRFCLNLFPWLYPIMNSDDPESEIVIDTEYPIRTSTGFIVGYWDIMISPKYHRYGEEEAYPTYIEVKPKIDSFGKVMRQIKTYQAYTYDRRARFVLYTQDTQFDTSFESQRIYVIHPPNPIQVNQHISPTITSE